MFRRIRSNHVRMFSHKTPPWVEIQIPMPWGHIAGKWWGQQDKRPILAIHGWQENCCSFDTLIPYLVKQAPFLAIDLPGLGLSSHLPPGTYHHGIDNVVTIKRIAQYFNWSKVSFLAHSLGAGFAYAFTTLYPSKVDFFISLDALTPLLFQNREFQHTSKAIDDLLRYEEINANEETRPNYTLGELQERIHRGSWKSVSKESAKYILERNVEPSPGSPGKFRLNRDNRTKMLFMLNWPKEFFSASVDQLKCPTIVIQARDTADYYRNYVRLRDVLGVFERHNGNYEHHTVDGTHHVHLNNPERVEGLINGFLKKYNTAERGESGLKPEIIVKA